MVMVCPVGGYFIPMNQPIYRLRLYFLPHFFLLYVNMRYYR